MRRINAYRIALGSMALSVLTTAWAQWSDWQTMSAGQFSMKSAQVNNSVCAFAFRNDTGMTLIGAQIKYMHSGRIDNDILPGLSPGPSVGEWSAFSVQDKCPNIEVEIYDVQWQ